MKSYILLLGLLLGGFTAYADSTAKKETEAILIGHGYDVEVVVDIDGLRPEDIGVEMILADQITDNKNVRVIAICKGDAAKAAEEKKAAKKPAKKKAAKKDEKAEEVAE